MKLIWRSLAEQLLYIKLLACLMHRQPWSQHALCGMQDTQVFDLWEETAATCSIVSSTWPNQLRLDVVQSDLTKTFWDDYYSIIVRSTYQPLECRTLLVKERNETDT